MSCEESIDSFRERVAKAEQKDAELTILRAWIGEMNEAIDSLPYYPDEPEEMVGSVVQLAKAMSSPIGDRFLTNYLRLQSEVIDNVQTLNHDEFLTRTREEGAELKQAMQREARRRFEHADLVHDAQSLNETEIVDRLREMSSKRLADWEDFFWDIQRSVLIEERSDEVQNAAAKSDHPKSVQERKNELFEWSVREFTLGETGNAKDLQEVVNKEAVKRGLTPYDSGTGNGVADAYKRAYKRIHGRRYDKDNRGRGRKRKSNSEIAE
ncbi:hypothetical protein Pla22_44330 [Rubripirellula amarantea]|uniref:Uncharacterized protein n=1 Tax=Rubripirellula amarantea TaxID=2527999 RepID=A0A5C5WGK4_9BACT|nr:hypothetical protein [Rubripirellula amarantea]TWT49241.1 hypothetical protein Pla22_44330 [Rubripirellula amarantea]